MKLGVRVIPANRCRFRVASVDADCWYSTQSTRSLLAKLGYDNSGTLGLKPHANQPAKPSRTISSCLAAMAMWSAVIPSAALGLEHTKENQNPEIQKQSANSLNAPPSLSGM